MANFLALYRGDTVGSADLVAVSADPDLVGQFADELLARNRRSDGDPVVGAVDEGRRRALKIVRDESDGRTDG